MIALALVVSLAQAQPQGAFGAARPAECGALEGFKAANVWERAKEPQLRRYCDLLASGTSKLVGAGALAKDVVTIAADADRLLPGRAAAKVLEGRAYLRLGKAAEAVSAFTEARRRDDRALDDPVALIAWARANARTGRIDEAVLAYRAALPRAGALAMSERSMASFEAGMIVMAQGQRSLDDAIAMLRQARREAQDALQFAALAGLALALDRSGQREEARAVLAERLHDGAKAMLADARVADALTDAGVAYEKDALLAFTLEGTDASGAREAWHRYLEGAGGKGPWAEHARQRDATSGARKAAPKPAAAPGGAR